MICHFYPFLENERSLKRPFIKLEWPASRITSDFSFTGDKVGGEETPAAAAAAIKKDRRKTEKKGARNCCNSFFSRYFFLIICLFLPRQTSPLVILSISYLDQFLDSYNVVRFGLLS